MWLLTVIRIKAPCWAVKELLKELKQTIWPQATTDHHSFSPLEGLLTFHVVLSHPKQDMLVKHG